MFTCAHTGQKIIYWGKMHSITWFTASILLCILNKQLVLTTNNQQQLIFPLTYSYCAIEVFAIRQEKVCSAIRTSFICMGFYACLLQSTSLGFFLHLWMASRNALFSSSEPPMRMPARVQWGSCAVESRSKNSKNCWQNSWRLSHSPVTPLLVPQQVEH